MENIVVAITGASGSIYAKLLLTYLEKLKDQAGDISIVFSSNARDVWKHELGTASYKNFSFKVFDKMDFWAPFASGSSNYKTMIICPCSMGTLGRIAAGFSDDLITRAADVMLKERRKLILMPREMPYSLIHLENMKKVTEAGAVICPASPGFYHQPRSVDEVASTVVERILDLSGLKIKASRWQQ